ncbi:MAG: methyltransferase domain-containing protein [Planctomycetota bacterium]
MDTDAAVRDRYGKAAQQREEALCCPVDYDATYLAAIPKEVIDRDYGCGDPSKHVLPGETVLDLGSGGGKICFIASQVVGAEGTVIGVDMNDDMLKLARDSAPVVAETTGFDNVHFCKGKIQDLAIDRDAVDRFLRDNPVSNEESLRDLEAFLNQMRSEQPMIADETIDVVVSNCVLNLVAAEEKPILFEELFRVLKLGGRAVISDIVSDQEVPLELQQDAELWSGCLSGALTLSDFLQAFEDAGLEDIRLLSVQSEPWQTVEGIEFRSVTVQAFRPESDDATNESGCCAGGERYVYSGPFKVVVDDAGIAYTRGEVCAEEQIAGANRASLRDQFAILSTQPKVGQHCEVPASPKALPMAGNCCDGGSC